jgi:inosine-uridine nucleoside N-ribohydrolase
MTRPPIVLDCDPGIDDAFALFCALRYCDLRAVTTVSGNVRIEDTTRNGLHLLDLVGRPDIPVHRGAAVPLEVEPSFASYVHGPSGLGAVPTPEPSRAASDTSAVDALLDLAGDVTIVATGPLTNVANAVLTDPDFAARAGRIHWMGGSTAAGNVTDVAEFNAWADPHAVDVVFGSGIPISMYGLNLTHQVRMTGEHASRLRAADTATSATAAAFLDFYEANGVQDGNGQPMHDPCAVLGLTDGARFTSTESHMVVDTADDSTRGWTRVVDADATKATPITVIETADAAPVIDRIMAAAIAPDGAE